jgi:type IV pilus assembly protein PilX
MGATNPMRGLRRGASSQRGAVLFVALIVLVAMLLGSVVLVRSVDTANIIAGNLTFKQTTVQAGDYGVEAAVAVLPDIATNTPDTDTQAATYWYYATRRAADINGIPGTNEAWIPGPVAPIDWSVVPVAAAVAGNTVRVIIDRLCRGPTPVTDIEANCFVEGSAAGGSKAIGRAVFTSTEAVFYRVTAHVTGPRNTVSIVQAIVSR